VAAGTSAAAKARRNDESSEIKIYEKDSHISYSACGTPYYIGGSVESIESLTPRNAAFFKSKHNVDVFIRHEVLSVNPTEKIISVKNLDDGNTFTKNYDKLIIATGAKSIIPPIDGIDKNNVFSLRNITSAVIIKNYINANNVKSALIVGSGFIGMELAENFSSTGIETTIVEMKEHLSPKMDSDVSVYIEDYISKKGISFLTGDSVTRFSGGEKAEYAELKSGKKVSAEIFIIAAGVKPEITLASSAGIEIGTTGAIKVNKKMQTNFGDIYACGDCAESYSVITGKPIYHPLGSTANKTGRIAGDQASGGQLEFRGILGTGIFKLFDMTIAQTGLTENEARAEGYDCEVVHNIKPDKPEYAGGKEMMIKAVADRKTQRLLGIQIVGYEGVDKRIDVFATAITFGAKVTDLFHLDLAYAPPFSTTKDPVMYTGMILDNAINGKRKLITPAGLKETASNGKIQIIDSRVSSQYDKAHVEGAENIPHEKLR
ncbi:MAG TPA: FAD-dependent oxidoreductase, partial [Spirochaetota bacterium]|nr:FAD-dependent oxidoreductase [Spirochaetota bacterium]HPM35708.1 FAD-dependent oxidoreductase [Spirochaetota bacterium]